MAAHAAQELAALEAKNTKLRQALEVSMHNQTALAERYNAMLRDYETKLSDARINQTLQLSNVETYVAFVGEIDGELAETGRTLLLGRWSQEPIDRLQRSELMAELKRLRLAARGPGSPRVASPLKRLDRSPSSRRVLKHGSSRIRKPPMEEGVASKSEGTFVAPSVPVSEGAVTTAMPAATSGPKPAPLEPVRQPAHTTFLDSPRPKCLSPDAIDGGDKVSFEDNWAADELGGGDETNRKAAHEEATSHSGAEGHSSSLNASIRSTSKHRDKRGSTIDGRETSPGGASARPSPPSIRRSRSIRPQRLVLVSYSDDVKHTVFTQEAKINELTQLLDRLTKKFRLLEQDYKETRDLLKRQERDLKDIVMSGLRRSAALLSRERDIRSGEGLSTSPVNQLAFYSQGEDAGLALDSGKQPEVPLGRIAEVSPPAVLPSLPPSSTFRVGRSAQSASRPRTVGGGKQHPSTRSLAPAVVGASSTIDSSLNSLQSISAGAIPLGWLFSFSSDLARLLLEFTKAKDYLEDLHRDLLQFDHPQHSLLGGADNNGRGSKDQHGFGGVSVGLSGAFGEHTFSSSSFVSGGALNTLSQKRKQFLQQIIDFDSPNLRLLVDPYLSLEPSFRTIVVQNKTVSLSSPLQRVGGRPSEESLQALQLMEEVWKTLNQFLVGHLEHLVVLIGSALKR